MKRLATLNRLFTTLIFVIVGSLTCYGYGSLVLDASVGRNVQEQFALYDTYRNLDDRSLSGEVHANVAWAAQPTNAAWARALATQRAFDASIASLRLRAPRGDRTAIAALTDAHRRAVAAARRVMALLAAKQSTAAKRVYDGSVLPSYEALSLRIEEAAHVHGARANVLATRWGSLERRLQFAMLGLGVLGLVVLTGLTFTLRAYRARADEATERELERLERAALTDSLTSLGNHRAFREDLLKEIARARRYGQALTLVLFDVDDFKTLNDARGHAHGDAVLVDTANTLAHTRREDRSYRIGGDEFATLLVAASHHRAKIILDRLRERLRQRLGNATVSIGFCELEGGFDEHDLYERADAALYAAKRNGRDMTVDFAAIREHTTIFPVRKAIALQHLLEQRGVAVHFQPIWSLASHEVLGFEALARPNPRFGLAGPHEAFDIAERQRRVADLDRLCVERAFEAAAGLSDRHALFVNLTPETLGQPDFQARRLAAAAREHGIAPQQLVIELTERRITDTNEMLHHVAELRELGMLIALDDTGAGFSGLEILTKFSFDYVKIDRSVVVEAMVHRRASGVLAGIISIAQQAGSFVIAEGIETPQQLSFLHRLAQGGQGPSGVQGFLLGRPQAVAPKDTAFASYRRLLTKPLTQSESAAS